MLLATACETLLFTLFDEIDLAVATISTSNCASLAFDFGEPLSEKYWV